MRNFFLALTVFSVFLLSPLRAESSVKGNISDSAEFYLLTCGPSDSFVWTLYGHSALRLKDPENRIDIVFNYGTFYMEDGVDFYYRFARGVLPYELSIDTFGNFMNEYVSSDRYVCSQRLDLDSNEKRTLAMLLFENYRPENRTYRYSFLYDNCSTRIRDIVDKAVGGRIEFSDVPSSIEYCEGKFPAGDKSYWNLLDEYMDGSEWVQWGIHTILGYPASEKAGLSGAMFLPDYLMGAFGNAVIRDSSGVTRPLAGECEVLHSSVSGMKRTPFLLSPAFVFSVMAAVVFLLMHMSVTSRCRRFTLILASAILVVTGLIGALLVFLGGFTSHPTTAPNFNMLWANPLSLMAVIMMCFRGRMLARVMYCVVFAEVVLVAAALVSWSFMGPSVSMDSIPLMIVTAISMFRVMGFFKEKAR